MTTNDPASESESGVTRSPGRTPTWRATWPIGKPDDFVTDLPDGGWARLRRIGDVVGRSEWEWTIDGRTVTDSGRASTREAAEGVLQRYLGTAPRI